MSPLTPEQKKKIVEVFQRHEAGKLAEEEQKRQEEEAERKRLEEEQKRKEEAQKKAASRPSSPFRVRMPDTITKVDPPRIKTFGRDEDIEDALDVLYKTRMRNLIFVGPTGCGKTHIFREIATRESKNFNFLELSISGMVSYGHYVGDFEQKCFEAFSYAEKLSAWNDKPTILFCDEIHVICGAGATDADHTDFANIAKPWLSSGRIILWGATTNQEFDDSIAKDSALLRRFQVMELPELGVESRIKAVENFMGKNATKEMVEYIVNKTPSLEKAIELADRLLGRHNRTGAPIDEALADAFLARMNA